MAKSKVVVFKTAGNRLGFTLQTRFYMLCNFSGFFRAFSGDFPDFAGSIPSTIL